MIDIDRQVSEQFMGWEQRPNTIACYDENGNDFLPSTNIADADLVLKELVVKGFTIRIYINFTPDTYEMEIEHTDGREGVAHEATLARAICLAALGVVK